MRTKHRGKIPGADGLLSLAGKGWTRTKGWKLKPDKFPSEIRPKCLTLGAKGPGQCWVLQLLTGFRSNPAAFLEDASAIRELLGSGWGAAWLACAAQIRLDELMVPSD